MLAILKHQSVIKICILVFTNIFIKICENNPPTMKELRVWEIRSEGGESCVQKNI